MPAFALAGDGRLVVDLMLNVLGAGSLPHKMMPLGPYTNNNKSLVQPGRLSVMRNCQELAIEHTYLRYVCTSKASTFVLVKQLN
jgi:hypothetical protein